MSETGGSERRTLRVNCPYCGTAVDCDPQRIDAQLGLDRILNVSAELVGVHSCPPRSVTPR